MSKALAIFYLVLGIAMGRVASEETLDPYLLQ
jgi:hypothetical protein